MFKKYNFFNGESSFDIFVRDRKSKKGGFYHEACAVGSLPTSLKSDIGYKEYSEAINRIDAARYYRMSYDNRTWEDYSGQRCLINLWKKLSGLKSLVMSNVCNGNPFESIEEPKHEDLKEPDFLFGFAKEASAIAKNKLKIG